MSQFGSPLAWLSLAVLITLPLRSAADTPLVNHSDPWRYHKGTSAAQTDWKTTPDSGLDASWLTGNGGFGYADNSPELALVQTPLADRQNGYTTVYMRWRFQITSAVDADMHLMLTMDWDDGFISWLDGVYNGAGDGYVWARFYKNGAPNGACRECCFASNLG